MTNFNRSSFQPHNPFALNVCAAIIFALSALILFVGIYCYISEPLLCEGLFDLFDGLMPGVRCPKCAESGIETWVLPGKHCSKCNYPCG